MHSSDEISGNNHLLHSGKERKNLTALDCKGNEFLEVWNLQLQCHLLPMLIALRL